MIDPRVDDLGDRNGGHLVFDGSNGVGLELQPFYPGSHFTDDILSNIPNGETATSLTEPVRVRITFEGWAVLRLWAECEGRVAILPCCNCICGRRSGDLFAEPQIAHVPAIRTGVGNGQPDSGIHLTFGCQQQAKRGNSREPYTSGMAEALGGESSLTQEGM